MNEIALLHGLVAPFFAFEESLIMIQVDYFLKKRIVDKRKSLLAATAGPNGSSGGEKLATQR